MARTSEATYFPALDKCLSGAATLVPWTSAYTALSDLRSASQNSALESFISDSETRDALARPLEPFQKASSQTKSLFDSKTAQINISQPPNNDYNLEQLKDDSLWISKELGIDEVSALRCAAVEWLQRPADLLLGKVQSKSGGLDFSQSYLGKSTAAQAESEDKAGPDFEDTELRRQRLVKICLEERSAAIACSALLISLAANKRSGDETTWVDIQAEGVHRAAAGEAGKLSLYIQAVTKLASTLDGPEHQPSALKERTELTATYYDAVTSDLVNAVRVILAQVFANDSSISSGDARDWFKLMQTFSFFDNLSPTTAAQNMHIQILQCLVSITSAAVLNLPQAMKDIEQKRSVAHGSSTLR